MDILRPSVLVLSCFLMMMPATRTEAGDDSALPVHELRNFRVRYLGLTCGRMTLESQLEECEGRSCYHIQMKAKNSKFFNRIYKVETTIDSWVDTRTLGSIRYESVSVEKGEEHREMIRLEGGEMIWTKKGKERRFKVPDDGGVLDPLAFLYRLQSFASSPGSRPRLFLMTTKGPMETVAQVSGLIRKKTNFGKRKVVRIHPRPVDGKMFSRKGDLSILVEPGRPPILHLVEFDLSFGHLKAELVKKQ